MMMLVFRKTKSDPEEEVPADFRVPSPYQDNVDPPDIPGLTHAMVKSVIIP